MVNTLVVAHPADEVKVTVSRPDEMPVAIPDVPIDALTLLTLHVPLPTSLNVVFAPIHNNRLPEIFEGVAFTVTALVEYPEQPPFVYE